MKFKKTTLLASLSLMLSLNVNAQKPVVNDFGELWGPKTYKTILINNNTRAGNDDQGELVEKILACPENTVYANTWVNDGRFSTGNMCADESREGMSSVFYSYVEANLFKVNGIKFYGLFKYYSPGKSWKFCDERGGMNENGDLTEPIRFRLSFHKVQEDGFPGEAIFSKEYDILGENTGIQLGNDISGFGYVYSFMVDFEEDVKLETGYVAITAVDMGDKPSCWFNMFTSNSANGHGLLKINDEDWMYALGPACFCLKGTGEMSAKKAIKFERFLSPKRTADGKHEKVAVEISNAGSEAVSGVELELWNGNELICTETIDKTIEPLMDFGIEGMHKHIFGTTIDCSNVGENKIIVKNVYKEDEKLCSEQISMTIHNCAEGEYIESSSEDPSSFHITNVKVGDIDNTTEGSTYSDFSNLKTNISLNNDIELAVITKNECNVLVWVDWNNNGNFGDEGELIGNIDPETGILNISVPNNIDIKPGDKRMRLVCTANWELPTYSGTYYYGETEDYTLTLERNAGQPGIYLDKDIVELTSTTTSTAVNVSNIGESDLSVNSEINYILPGSPDGLNVYHSTAKAPEEMKEIMLMTSPIKKSTCTPKKDIATAYVMGYDRNPYNSVSLQAEEGVFGQLFPAKMVASLEGMTISSVDVYIGDLPTSTSIVIYEEGDKENHVGKILTEQKFNAVKDSWNRVILDKPIKLSSTNGIVVAIKIIGFPNNSYCLGIDGGNAVIGYGDLIMAGDYWWSMHDLDINANVCIRANITGEKTPAISWLDVDKLNMNLLPGNNDNVNISYNGTKMDNSLYSAIIELTTNDELRQTVRIPVYCIDNTITDIISANIGESEITYANNEIKIVSKKDVFNISIYNINGQLLENIDPTDNETVISTNNIDKGIYIISVMYADGNRQGIKIPIMK